jgi:hypothetical protein
MFFSSFFPLYYNEHFQSFNIDIFISFLNVTWATFSLSQFSKMQFERNLFDNPQPKFDFITNEIFPKHLDFLKKQKTETFLWTFLFHFPKFVYDSLKFEKIFYKILKTNLKMISQNEREEFPSCLYFLWIFQSLNFELSRFKELIPQFNEIFFSFFKFQIKRKHIFANIS